MKFFQAILVAYAFFFSKDSEDTTVSVKNDVGSTNNNIDNEGGLNISRDIRNHWVRNQAIHRPKNLSKSRLTRVADMARETELKAILAPILVPRVAGTPGNAAVRKHITDRLESLPGWHIESHSFIDNAPAPFGKVNFTNIIATHNINAPRRLVLACHHDSKYMAPRTDGKMFVGATDSAVPCAMLIHLAENLHSYIESKSVDFPELTIQLLFFDGEEAFVRWTNYDSTYGSRKLAARMAANPHSDTQSRKREIDAMDVFVLLDLIGDQYPVFHNYFSETTNLFSRMQRLENKLNELNKLQFYKPNRVYFDGSSYGGRIEDDHIPFLNRGVKILHLIPSPFPSEWHKITDDEAHLDYPTIMNLQRIVQAFVAEYMLLSV